MREPVDEVAAALDLVSDEAESAIEDVKAQLRAAADDERFGDLDELRQRLEAMRGLTNEITSIRDRWLMAWGERYLDEEDGAGEPESEPEPAGRRFLGRVPRGTRTPEAAFRRPILEALEELGGAGSLVDVLALVEAKMNVELGPVDYEPLPSNSETVRWRNTAQWSRNELVRLGLLLPVRKRGTWEISEEGRVWLARR